MSPVNVADFGIVDTHCHLWHWELLRKAWQAPATIARTYEAKDLEAVCAPAGVRQCVLIEAGCTPEDNKALEGFADSSDLITGVVPYIDWRDPGLDAQMDYWQKRPKFCGIRMGFEGKPDPELMTCRASIEGFRKLAARGIPFEFLVTTRDLSNILKVYEQVPELISVIEHLGKPDLLHGTDWKEWSRVMKDLANHTQALCKLSLGPRGEDIEYLSTHQQQGWEQGKFKPYIQHLLESFGPKRLLWGSDWPLLLLEGDYYHCYEATRIALGPLDRETEVQIFRTTAVNTYHLPAS